MCVRANVRWQCRTNAVHKMDVNTSSDSTGEDSKGKGDDWELQKEIKIANLECIRTIT